MPEKKSVATKVSADPAANVEISLTLDEDIWIESFVVTLVTDANAANRHVHFTLEDASGNVYARWTAGGTQAASLTRQYSGVPGLFSPPAVLDTNFLVPLAPQGVFAPKGSKLKTATTLRQAGDNFSALVLSGQRA